MTLLFVLFGLWRASMVAGAPGQMTAAIRIEIFFKIIISGSVLHRLVVWTMNRFEAGLLFLFETNISVWLWGPQVVPALDIWHLLGPASLAQRKPGRWVCDRWTGEGGPHSDLLSKIGSLFSTLFLFIYDLTHQLPLAITKNSCCYLGLNELIHCGGNWKIHLMKMSNDTSVLTSTHPGCAGKPSQYTKKKVLSGIKN